MTIFIIILFIAAIITNLLDIVFSVKSANRKAHYTMLEIKALRQVRDKLERLRNDNSNR